MGRRVPVMSSVTIGRRFTPAPIALDPATSSKSAVSALTKWEDAVPALMLFETESHLGMPDPLSSMVRLFLQTAPLPLSSLIPAPPFL